MLTVVAFIGIGFAAAVIVGHYAFHAGIAHEKARIAELPKTIEKLVEEKPPEKPQVPVKKPQVPVNRAGEPIAEKVDVPPCPVCRKTHYLEVKDLVRLVGGTKASFGCANCGAVLDPTIKAMPFYREVVARIDALKKQAEQAAAYNEAVEKIEEVSGKSGAPEPEKASMTREEYRKRVAELLAKHEVKEPRCGFSIGPGWFEIVDRALGELVAAGWDRDLAQVKEKFGGLRIYLDSPSNPEHTAIIERAEMEADRTCEDCGAPGKIRPRGWSRTLCETHDEEQKARLREPT